MSGGMKTTLKVVNLSEFSGGLNKLKRAARDQALRDTVEAGARVIQANAMINANNVFSSKATNALANSIIVEVSGSGNKVEAQIGPTVIYGRIQELGGIIKPVFAKILHWVEDGVDIFANVVHLPGSALPAPGSRRT